MNHEPSSEQPTSLSPFAVETQPPPLPRKAAATEELGDDDLAIVRPRPLWPTLVIAAVASLIVGGAATGFAAKGSPKHEAQASVAAMAMAPSLPPLESRKIPPPPAHVDIPPVAPAAPVSDVPVSAAMDAPGAADATPLKAPAAHAPPAKVAHPAPPPPPQKKAAPTPAKPVAKAKPMESKKATKAAPPKKKG